MDCARDADGFAGFDGCAGREIAAVAMDANAPLAFAGEHGADAHTLEGPRPSIRVAFSRRNFLVTRMRNSFGFVGFTMSFAREAAHEPVADA